MAAKYIDTITAPNGNVIEGAGVQVLTGAGAAVSLYADANLSTLIGTQALTDEMGLVEFYVADGTYTVRQSYLGVSVDLPNTELYDLSDIAAGSGTVTSVAVAGGTTGLTTTGGPVTTAGTITLGGALAATSGGVPAGGASGQVLAKIDGTSYNTQWIPAPSGGGATSVGLSGGTTGLTVSNSPITTSGVMTLAGTVVAASGGTGQTSYAVGDILAASTTTALSKVADIATGNALLSGGVGALPAYGKVGLTTHVTGVLPVANGGTGGTTALGTAAFKNTGTSGNTVPLLDGVNAFAGNTRIGSTVAPTVALDVTGDLKVSANLQALTVYGLSTVRTGSFTAATLPSAAASGVGTRTMIGDSSTSTFYTVVAGGGGAAMPVVCDGVNWRNG